MKSKKKMLLALGAMSAAAIGAGATSTFAWYTSTLAATAAKGDVTSTVTTAKLQADGENLEVNFTFTDVAEKLPELTNDAGETWYYVGGQLKPKTVNQKPVGQMTVSAAFSVDDKAVWNADTAHSDDEYYTTTLTLSSPLVLLNKDATTAIYDSTDTENDDVADDPVTIKIKIEADGDIVVQKVYGAAGDTIFYAVRAASPAAQEAEASVNSTIRLAAKYTLTDLADSTAGA